MRLRIDTQINWGRIAKIFVTTNLKTVHKNTNKFIQEFSPFCGSFSPLSILGFPTYNNKTLQSFSWHDGTITPWYDPVIFDISQDKKNLEHIAATVNEEEK